MHGWGSRGRGFKSRRPDRKVAGQKGFRIPSGAPFRSSGAKRGATRYADLVVFACLRVTSAAARCHAQCRREMATSDGFSQHVLGHSNAMNAYTPGTGNAWSDNDPVCRVVWNAWSGQVEGVAVWNPRTWTWDVVRPTGTFAAEVRAAFADVIGEEIVNAIWSGAGIRPPASRSELLSVVEGLLDPQVLILKLVQATAQVAALHAGFPPPIARLVGYIAREICKDLLGQDPRASRVQVARWADFAFSAETGSWIGSSGLRELATDRISELIGPDGRGHPRAAQEPTTVSPAVQQIVDTLFKTPAVQPHDDDLGPSGFSP
jgi:hypothetical protein